MEIINWLGFAMLPIGIIISILLIIVGTIKQVKFINPRDPLGRLLFFFGSGFAFVIGLLSLKYGHTAMYASTIRDGLIYNILGYSFCIYGFTFFFMTGMRRASDIGIPFWIYPTFIIITLLSRLINEEISEFLFLGMYIFLLQPGRNNN